MLTLTVSVRTEKCWAGWAGRGGGGRGARVEAVRAGSGACLQTARNVWREQIETCGQCEPDFCDISETGPSRS